MRKHQLKVLGLSALAVLGVMAVSASAAQAKWLIKVNGSSVEKTNVVGTVGAWHLTTEEMPLQIRCNGGAIEATLKTIAGNGLVGTGVAEFTGCLMIGLTNICKVNSPGRPAGAIKVVGEGSASMEGSTTFLEMSSEEFTTVVISGELCPLNEFEQEIAGTVALPLVSPEAEQKSHIVEFAVPGQEIFFNGLGAATVVPTEEEESVTGTLQVPSGEPWSIQLVGL